MMKIRKWASDARVPLCMLVVQLIATGFQILSRVILSEGTFILALITYRNIVVAFSVLPFALYFERGAVRKLTFAIFFWLFMVALMVSMGTGFFYYGLKDTTATYAASFLNLIPVVTFLLSTVLRVERLRLGTRAGKVKTIGALLCLAGALIITLYKGNSVIHIHLHRLKIINHSNQNKTRGTIFLVGCCLSLAFWYILQAKLYKVFPHKYWGTLFTCIIGSVQASMFGLCIDRKPKSWRLGWDLQLLTILYSGILSTAITFCLISMAIRQRGPTYPSMFSPLSLILVAIAEALFLGEIISMGSLIGMTLIITGLYSFLWGKNKEMKDIGSVLMKSDGGVSLEDGTEATMETVGLQSPNSIVPGDSGK